VTRRFLLDTNILSDAQKPQPDQGLAAWMESQADDALFIATVVLGEIWRGILLKSEGSRRRALIAWFAGLSGPRGLFAGRVLPLDETAALEWAELMAEGQQIGRPRSAIDMQIAAIARVNGCTLVTRNCRHFTAVRERVEVLDPSGP
jgi:predicted nucleic acid-binding protein